MLKDPDSVHSRQSLEIPSLIGTEMPPDAPLPLHHQVPPQLLLAAASLTDLKNSDHGDDGDSDGDDDDDIAFPLCIVNLENCSRLRKLPHLQKCI